MDFPVKSDKSCMVAGSLQIFGATALAVRGVGNEACRESCVKSLAERCSQAFISWFSWASTSVCVAYSSLSAISATILGSTFRP